MQVKRLCSLLVNVNTNLGNWTSTASLLPKLILAMSHDSAAFQSLVIYLFILSTRTAKSTFQQRVAIIRMACLINSVSIGYAQGEVI